MLNTLTNLAKTFFEVAQAEDQFLQQHGRGIFFMPELAFAYACGRAAIANQQAIFGQENVEWRRELVIHGSGGPSDLVFELSDGYKIVVEFKMEETWHRYLEDIKKLSSIDDPKSYKLFFALSLPFTINIANPIHVKNIEREVQHYGVLLTRLLQPPFPSFGTRTPQYENPENPVSAQALAWAVGPHSS